MTSNVGSFDDKMANVKGKVFRGKLPLNPPLVLTDHGQQQRSLTQKKSQEELPEDTDSVGSESDESVSILSQSMSSKLPVQLKRENAVIEESNRSLCGEAKGTSEWSVSEVKEWVFELFGSKEIACKFEEEEIDGRILLSSTVRSNEALEKLGLCTIGKKGKFLEKTEELAGAFAKKTKKIKSEGFELLSASDFSSVDRLLSNAEKNELTSQDRSVYNTKKRKITNYIKGIWPVAAPTPRFRNHAENTKKLMKVVETLSNNEEFTFRKAGLGSNAISQIVRKHMDERRRKEAEVSLSSRSESDLSSPSSSNSEENSPGSVEKNKAMQLEDYFNSELSLASAEAVLLVWLGKTSIHEVRLDKDLKPAAKDFGLRLLRNKDKQMHVKAIASYLIENGLVEVTCTDLKSISREDVQLKKK